MSEKEPATIQENNKLKGVSIPRKYAGWVAGGLLTFAVLFGYVRAYMLPSPVAGAKKIAGGNNAEADSIDPGPAATMRSTLGAESAKNNIASRAAAMKQDPNSTIGVMQDAFGRFAPRQQQDGTTATHPGYGPYGNGMPTSQSSSPTAQELAAERKAEALKAAQEKEERLFKASKAPLAGQSFSEPTVQRIAATAAAPEVSAPVIPAVVKSTVEVEEPKVKTYTLWEGTYINAVFVGGINAAYAGPVVAKVTDDVRSDDRTVTLLKAGATIIGEASRVSESGQERVAIRFNRIRRQDRFSLLLDEDDGLSQDGATAVKDKVNHHYPRTLIMAGGIGLLAGFSMMGTSGYYGGGADMYRQGFSQSLGNSGQRLLQHYLSMPPDVTIRPGWRVIFYNTKDRQLPAQE